MLAEADDLSAKALALMPWEPLFKGTRGGVLVELGRIEEGVVLLHEAMKANSAEESKALNACCLALAMSRKGNYIDAARYLTRAGRLDSNCTLISRAEREVEERRASKASG